MSAGSGALPWRVHARERAERPGWCLGRPDHRPAGAVSCEERVGRGVGLAGRLDGPLHGEDTTAWQQEPLLPGVDKGRDQIDRPRWFSGARGCSVR